MPTHTQTQPRLNSGRKVSSTSRYKARPLKRIAAYLLEVKLSRPNVTSGHEVVDLVANFRSASLRGSVKEFVGGYD